ncbi:MAG: general secretion pathway protein GspF [Bacteroidetes bacterium]|nr:MAG: general secretion pathway protein GspF [Bacteroidota bacterium]
MDTIDLRQFKWDNKDNFKIIDNKNNWFEKLISVLNKDIALFSPQLSIKRKGSFFSELGSLISSGIDIRTAIELSTSSKKKDLIFKSVLDEVVAGQSFSIALKNSKKFSAYDFYSIQIGEETGQLPRVLEQLSDFYSKQIDQKQQLISTSVYPALVICTAFGAVYFMLNFIVPMFADVFTRFDGELPALTQWIINASSFVSAYFYLAVLFASAMIAMLIIYRKNEKFRKHSSAIIIKIPLVGEVVKKVYLARFCNSMQLLLSSQVPLLRTFGLVKEMVRYYPLEISLTNAEKEILNGKPLHKSLGMHSIYDAKFIALLKLGEEVNKLPEFFKKIADQYNKEIDHKTKIMGTILEPLIIIFLGVMVGLILVAMYIPMFQMSTKMF